MKKIYIRILMSLMVVLMAGIAYGACTFNVPSDSDVLKGTERLNVTCTLGYNVSNCNVTATSATSGSSVATYYLINDTTAGAILGVLNVTTTTKDLKDASDYVFAGVCYNASTEAVFTITSKSGITIDNTKPVYSDYSPSDNTVDSDGIVDFSVTCSNTTSATLYIESTPYTMTESSDVCTASVSTLRNSISSWYVSGSDGLNITSSSTTKVEIRKSGGGIVQGGQLVTGAIQPTAQQPQQQGLRGFIGFLFSIPMRVLGAIFSVFK